jgi:hypothetical protein
MHRFIVINHDNYLFCKNCNSEQPINYTNLNQFTDTMIQFKSQHKDCAQANELITLQEVADLSGIAYNSLRSYGQKLNLPQPVLIGCRKYYNKKLVIDYLKNNDIKNNLSKVRNEYYLTKIKVNIEIIKNNNIEKQLPLINRFLRGEFETKERQLQKQSKIEASKNNQTKTIVLKCFEDSNGNVSRRFV